MAAPAPARVDRGPSGRSGLGAFALPGSLWQWGDQEPSKKPGGIATGSRGLERGAEGLPDGFSPDRSG